MRIILFLAALAGAGVFGCAKYSGQPAAAEPEPPKLTAEVQGWLDKLEKSSDKEAQELLEKIGAKGSGAKRAASRLVQFIQHNEKTLDRSVFACIALGRIGAVDELATFLTSDSPSLRFASILGMGNNPALCKAGIPALLRCMDNPPDSSLCYEAACAIHRIAPESEDCVQAFLRVARNLKVETQERQKSIFMLGKLGKQAGSAVPGLNEMLCEPEYCQVAVQAISEIGANDATAEALLVVLNCVRMRDRRIVVIRRLSGLKEKAAFGVPFLRQAMQDEKLLEESQVALAMIGPAAREAVPDLIKVLSPTRAWQPSDARRFVGAARALFMIGEKKGLLHLAKVHTIADKFQLAQVVPSPVVDPIWHDFVNWYEAVARPKIDPLLEAEGD